MSPYERTNDLWHRRRAQKYGVKRVRIRPKDIFERDGWRCHVCGRFVRRYGDSEHPMAATLDHVIPISEGGMHTPDNVKTAHWICNVKRNIEAQKYRKEQQCLRRWKKKWNWIGSFGWQQSVKDLCSNWTVRLAGNDCY